MVTVSGQSLPRARARVPQVRGWPRVRLHAALEPIGPGRPALVLAPAGCGKTTLLAQWVLTRPGALAWYRAEAADRAVAACLARALDVSGVPAPGEAPRIEDLVEAIEAAGTPVTLVLDDVHELRDAAAVADVERLLLLAPPNLTLALSGRVGLPLNLARSELSDRVQLTGDDLRFRSWEVEELFRDFHHEPLRPDDAAALARRTDGWAAALQLFHLATHGRAPANRSRAVRALAAPARYAKEYLSAQVLNGLPPRLQLLLRRTCVFDVVTASRCDALLSSNTAQADLDELVARQALTTSDDGGATFRYHEVLRSYLQGVLHEELGDAGARQWYRRAAAVVEAEGDLHAALRIRCRGGDWDGVRLLLDRNGEQLAAHDSREWTALLPASVVRDDPWVLLAVARRLLDEGDLAAAAQTAREAQLQFGAHSGRERCRDVVRVASAWTGAPQPVSPTWADMLRAATQRNPRHWAERARRELPDPTADLVAGIALLVAGDRREARSLLGRVADGAGASHAELAARLVLASAPLDLPGPGTAAALDTIAAEAEARGAGWLARLAGAMVRASSEGGLAEAPQLARRAEAEGDVWGSLVLRLWLIGVQAQAGVLNTADLDEVIATCRDLSAGALEAWPRATRAMVAATEGRPDADAEARSAEAFARAAGSPGAQAIAYAALGVARGADGEELRQLAEATGEAAGFDIDLVWPAPAPVYELEPDPGDAAGPYAVEVACFGPFQLRVGGVDVGLTSARPRARSLLRLLALHAEQPVHRERLTDLLWRDLDGDAATRSLHVALSSLRRILPETAGSGVLIERDGDAYRLVLGPHARTDVQEFTTALHAAEQAAGTDPAAQATALQGALALYGGDLLPEEGAAEWVLGAREQYRLLAVGAAGDLAQLELAADRAGCAAVAARRGLQIDRYDDRCWRVLIAALRAQGAIAAARQAELEYHAVLQSLGVEDDEHPPVHVG